MNENMCYTIKVGEAKSLEPLLKPCFGFTVYNSLSEECANTQVVVDYFFNSNEELNSIGTQCQTKDGLDAAKFGMMFDDEILEILLPNNIPVEKLQQLLNTHLAPQDDMIKKGISLMTAILYRDRMVRNSEIGYIEDRYDEYTQSVRPDMLKLYIALHEKPLPGCSEMLKLSFGGNKPITLSNNNKWMNEVFDSYLNKYLGVANVEEAQRELDTIYYKTSGRKDNKMINRYTWGLHHLLCMSSIKPKNNAKMSMDILRFIHEYMCMVGFEVNDVDGQSRIKSRLHTLLKNYKTVDELYVGTSYKLSPNNPDCVNTTKYY